MKLIHLFSALLLAMFVCQDLSAQNEGKPLNPKQKLRLADDLYLSGDPYTAIKYYKEYMEDMKQEDPEVLNKVALCYKDTRDYANAAPYFKKAFDADKENLMLQFEYALMEKCNGNYSEAKPAFENFAKMYAGANILELKKWAQNEAEGCDYAIRLAQPPPPSKNPKTKTLINLLSTNINNPYTDYAPIAPDDNTLIYSSMKSDTIIDAASSKHSEYVSKIYTSKRENGEWTPGEEFSKNINAPDVHCGNGSFSPDKRWFYFSRCEEVEDGNYAKTRCTIWRSHFMDNKWGEAEQLPEPVNMQPFNSTHPALAPGMKGGFFLYFTSDRTMGSQGGKDLWYCAINSEGGCGPVSNLGKKINTGINEQTPFYDVKDSMLYFSSNGQMNIGGFDVFKAKGAGKKFGDPVNCGIPINSPADDMFFTTTPDHNYSYVVSNRKGGYEVKNATCCDDIYELSKERIPYWAVKGRIYDEADVAKKKPLDLVLISLKPDCPEQTVTRYDTTFRRALTYFFDLPGNCSFTMKAQRQGYYVSRAANCSTIGKAIGDTVVVDLFLKKIEKKAVKIQGIFYDFDKATLRPESEPALTSLLALLNENPQLRVQINSHTDNKGNDDYNMELSQGRANSVVEYLVAHGIDSTRLVPKGFGETMPDTLNSNPDGTDCPEGRQKNRRTEFEIIGTVAGTQIIYEQGNPMEIDSTASTYEKIRNEQRGLGRSELKADGTGGQGLTPTLNPNITTNPTDSATVQKEKLELPTMIIKEEPKLPPVVDQKGKKGAKGRPVAIPKTK